jgi:hypothetical protein
MGSFAFSVRALLRRLWSFLGSHERCLEEQAAHPVPKSRSVFVMQFGHLVVACPFALRGKCENLNFDFRAKLGIQLILECLKKRLNVFDFQTHRN